MLNWLVEHSLRHRVIVVALAVITIVYGLQVAYHAKLDVFPDFTPPQVDVQTEAPGLSAEQVEALITTPVESAMNGVPNTASIRSQSIQGLSVITATFKDGTDIRDARAQLGQALLDVQGALPAGVGAPKMGPLTSATMDLLKLGFTSDKLSPMELRTLIDTAVKPRLIAVEGVAHVNSFGGEVPELQIQVDPAKLAATGVSLQNVLDAARSATGVRGTGYIDTGPQRVVVQTEGQLLTPELLGNVTIPGTDRLVRLRDVATVVVAPEPQFGETTIEGGNGVLLTLLSQYGSNTLETQTRALAALKEIQPTLDKAGVKVHDHIFRPGTFIETAVHNIKESLLIGGVLVAVVLFLFLFNLRTAFISLTAIPLSLLIAIIILNSFGATLNTITLGGLAIAIGEVVDDAIIDVENIHRRLIENSKAANPRNKFRVVLDASLEVRSAVVYATFIVALVFLPVLTMSGLQGRMFAPLGIAYILAVMASLLVALSLTPALSYLLLASEHKEHGEPFIVRWIKGAYHWLLAHTLRHPWWIIGAVVVLCLVTLAISRGFGGEFLPEFREGHFVVQTNGEPGASLDDMKRLGRNFAAELKRIKHVGQFEQQIGRAELGEDPWGTHRSEWHINLEEGTTGAQQAKVEEEIRGKLEHMPGVASFEVTTFLGDRIGETIAGETAEVVVSVFGQDLDQLDAKANEVRNIMSTVNGAADLTITAPPGMPLTTVKLRPERLARFDLRPVDVLDAQQTALQGTTVAQIFQGPLVRDVVVVVDPKLRRDPEAIGDMVIQNPAGERVLLSQVADIDLSDGRFMLEHDAGRRRVAVTCNVKGRDVSSFVAEVKQKVAANVTLPRGFYISYSGAAEAREAARHDLLLHSGIAGLGILLLLALVFRNFNNLMLVLVNLPFALVGGALALAYTSDNADLMFTALRHGHLVKAWELFTTLNGNLAVGSMVGFVTLFGITTRNSIMMLSHYEHLVRNEGVPWGPDAALRGAGERLLPILMTALVTALGLLPIALYRNEAGREIEGQMAVVILGGLATSTLLNLFVLPTLALRFGRFVAAPPESDASPRPVPGSTQPA